MEYPYYVSNEEYEHAESIGVSKNVIECRMRNYGWSKEKAVNTPLIKTRDFHNNIKENYPEIFEILKENRIHFNTFKRRVQRDGWSIEKASTTSVNTRYWSKEKKRNE